MTALARGIYTLAFIAFAMMQPTGQWFCTETNTLCSTPSLDCCNSEDHDCCDEDTEQEPSDPCCVEIADQRPVVPGSNSVSLPELLVVDCFLPFGVDFLGGLVKTESNRWTFTGNDPPPNGSASFARFCVRLI